MGTKKAHYNFDRPKNPSEFAQELGLSNLTLSIYHLKRGEGFDCFHNHREQEEIYLCLSGSAEIVIADPPERIPLERGDVVKVEPRVLRALGNSRSPEAVVLLAGACPHPYPAGIEAHEVIADVLSIVGHGTTGFHWPKDLPTEIKSMEDDEC